MHTSILAVGLTIVGGHLLTGVFRRWRIPDVLVLLIAGVGIGPYGVGLATPDDFGKVGPVLTTIALIVILLEGGVDLDLRSIRAAAGDTLRLTAATSLVTAAIVGSVTYALKGDPWIAAMLAVILSGTSAAVVIPMASALGLGQRTRAILSLESALTDVVCIVLTFGLLEAWKVGEFSSLRLVGDILSSLVMASVMGAAGGVAWLLALQRVRQLPHTLTVVFAVVFVIYGVAEEMGFSGAIAALTFGITLANPPERLFARLPANALTLERVSGVERGLFGEAVFLVKLFFFIFFGLSLRLQSWEPFGIAVGITLAIYLGRALITRLLLSRSSSQRDAAVTAVMAPKGLAAAVLAAQPFQRGVPQGDWLQEVAFGVVVVSILLTSLGVPLVEAAKVARLRALLFSPFAAATPSDPGRPAGPPPAG